jgi:hypothetical protein
MSSDGTSSFSPYVSTIGLYNDAQELLAVAKMAAPTPISANTDMTFLVKFDTQWIEKPYFTPTPSPSRTPYATPSSTPTISVTPSVTPTVTPSVTPSTSIGLSPSATPSISVTPSITITPSVTPSISKTVSVTPTISTTPSLTPTITPSTTPPAAVCYGYINYSGSTLVVSYVDCNDITYTNSEISVLGTICVKSFIGGNGGMSALNIVCI